jgi:hypothetical protein
MSSTRAGGIPTRRASVAGNPGKPCGQAGAPRPDFVKISDK